MGGGGYRGSVNAGPPVQQQNYGNNYGGETPLHPHTQPPPQQPYYGQPLAPPQQQMYHQNMSNPYQQLGHMPRPMNAAPPSLDTRGYGQPPQHQMTLSNRS